MIKFEDGRLHIESQFSSSDEELDSMINWIERNALIKDSSGKAIFEQKNLLFPDFWSDTAVNIVADKYFRGKLDSPDREKSLKQIVCRVVDTITKWGLEDGYFDKENSERFNSDLKFLIYNQYYSFNSPVWFGVGVDERPQTAACFLQSVDDTMESIMELAKNEAIIFKGGSGSGTNYSNIRSKNESLKGGGKASGPVSFMKGYDAFAGAIKSGGRTRRAAKLAALNVNHPDIIEFIESKRIEEEKAVALIEAGYSSNFTDENGAYATVAFQNENHSVRVTDQFMDAVKNDKTISFYSIKEKRLLKTIPARYIFTKICECAHSCGDPGIQFDDIINEYHTTPKSGRINISNPCSEILDIDDSSCNLGSHNLMRYVSRQAHSFDFDIESFYSAVQLTTLAQEILIDRSSYPTEKITRNTRRHRQLGVGFANLGTLIMYCGYPYDSDEARSLASSISSMMTAAVYYTSSLVAKKKGPFEAFEENKQDVLRVLKLHKDHNSHIIHMDATVAEIDNFATTLWEDVLSNVERTGLRNSKATAIAPTGTIGLMMDCDTTGVEPELSLIKYKNMVGGGQFKIINKNVSDALRNLGYVDKDITDILSHLDTNEELENCRILSREHLPVFDCALSTSKSGRSIKPSGHVKMVAAIQPFISGGISKTINMPYSSTIEDIYEIFMMAYDLRTKCITVYRDGSKSSQPIELRKKKAKEKQQEIATVVKRHHMPDERKSVTHKFTIGGVYKGYLTVGFYPDGKPGEIFIESAKAGSMMNGLLDCFATSISMCLQYGVPVKKIVSKFAHVSFEPQGFTPNKEIGYARSIVDYIARYLDKFTPKVEVDESIAPILKEGEILEAQIVDEKNGMSSVQISSYDDAFPCSRCGAMMIRSGTCLKCERCGETTGCG